MNATNYRKLVGSLRYMVYTRPNISYSISVVSKYATSQANPLRIHKTHPWICVKGTTEYALMYYKGIDGKLIGYSDSSYSNDRDDGRGTIGLAYYYSGNLNNMGLIEAENSSPKLV